MNNKNYILGLDLGIASVGWACVEVAIHTDKDGKEQAQPMGLIDCGVRCFEKAELPTQDKTAGYSKNALRRNKRSQRRTIKRRASRMREVRKLLFKHGLLTKNEFQAAYTQNTQDKTFFKKRNQKLLNKINSVIASEQGERGNPLITKNKTNACCNQEIATPCICTARNDSVAVGWASQPTSKSQDLHNAQSNDLVGKDAHPTTVSGSLKDGEQAFFSNVWQLRVKALQHKLERAEFAAVICHLVKHRGYLSTRKSEHKNADAETGKMLKGVTENHNLLKNKEYQSPAEIAVYTFRNHNGQPQYRNKQVPKKDKDGNIKYDKDGKMEKEGSYLHTFNRLDLENELQLIFERQKSFGNEYADKALCQKIKHILHYQKPALQGDALKKMWGKCSVYENELRAPKHSYTGERFVWISELHKLKIKEKGRERKLTDEEWQLLKEIVFRKLTAEEIKLFRLRSKEYLEDGIQFKHIRQLLKLPENATFNSCRYVYDKDKTPEQNLVDSEKTVLFEAKFFHALRKEYAENGLENEWGALKNNPAKLDQIGEVLAFYKEDKDRRQHLGDFSNDEIDVILELNFDKSLNLSLKAIREILPFMENGLRYDEACKKCEEKYGNQYNRNHKKQVHDKLPPIDKKDPDTPNNPVVYRTITQARKIINALIAQHGKPFRVHIEMGRDLGKSRDERNKIEKQNKENQAERERASNDFEELFGFKPKGKDILLKRLYDNQHGKCLYSGKPIDLERIFEKGYVEIDHAIPFSRSWDDSQNNKVLVLGAENQNKGNKTPFEWLGHDEQKWRDFEARVNNCRFSLRKKQNILRRELDDKEFIERNINDTRYATRFLKNYLENNLAFSGSLKREDGGEVKKVFAPQGQITSLLRNSWGFSKVREDNDRHHALDAVIVACATESMQQKITAYKKWFEIKRRKKDHWDKDEWDEFDKLLQRKQEKVDTETGEVKYLFPVPWGFPEWFNTEINLRVFNQVPKRDENGDIVRVENKIQYEPLNNPYQKEELLDALAKHLPNCPQAIHDNVTPLFVSRMARRSATGGVNKDTLTKAKDTKNKEYKMSLRGGYSDYEPPVRLDIFNDENGNNYFVPIYTHIAAQKLSADKLPCPNAKDKKGNDIATQFRFSLYPNDLVEIESDGVKEFAYYLWISATNGQTCFKTPDGSSERKGTGKTEKGQFKKYLSSIKIDKCAVGILGKNITRIEQEERQGFDELFNDDDD